MPEMTFKSRSRSSTH